MEKLEELVAAFNRGSLDVPAGFITPKTTYSLNGRSYESFLGGSPDDPLIKLLARGTGGYRTAAKALQFALEQQPLVTVQSLTEPDADGVRTAVVRIEGRLRGSGQLFDGRWSLKLVCVGDQLGPVELACSEEDLKAINNSRR